MSQGFVSRFSNGLKPPRIASKITYMDWAVNSSDSLEIVEWEDDWYDSLNMMTSIRSKNVILAVELTHQIATKSICFSQKARWQLQLKTVLRWMLSMVGQLKSHECQSGAPSCGVYVMFTYLYDFTLMMFPFFDMICVFVFRLFLCFVSLSAQYRPVI